MTRYVISQHNEDPPEGMVDWLHENPRDWDGDECGITFYDADGEMVGVALPGDTVFIDEFGVYKVEKADV